MKRVIIFVADGFEEIEAISVIDILRRANIKVDICSVTGKNILVGAHNISVASDVTKDVVRCDDYDACVLPGGMPGAKTLSNDEFVRSFFVEMNRQGKLCCAICAAPMALYKYGLLKGKKCVSYPGFLENYSDVILMDGPVQVDGNIITATGPAAAAEFAFCILETMGLSDAVSELRKGMLFEK
ncbi:MAG: DJ-1/PfpI family protein [Clostridia bacterium]|nr:DJ-1/PfpI family protein [Clostridia bacterium]